MPYDVKAVVFIRFDEEGIEDREDLADDVQERLQEAIIEHFAEVVAIVEEVKTTKESDPLGGFRQPGRRPKIID